MNADQPTPDVMDVHSTAWANFVNGIDVDLLQFEQCVQSALTLDSVVRRLDRERPGGWADRSMRRNHEARRVEFRRSQSFQVVAFSEVAA